jgi:hypothetical protein
VLGQSNLKKNAGLDKAGNYKIVHEMMTKRYPDFDFLELEDVAKG